jgi:hypothetical protein
MDGVCVKGQEACASWENDALVNESMPRSNNVPHPTKWENGYRPKTVKSDETIEVGALLKCSRLIISSMERAAFK